MTAKEIIELKRKQLHRFVPSTETGAFRRDTPCYICHKHEGHQTHDATR